jgi:hypothetical protein
MKRSPVHRQVAQIGWNSTEKEFTPNVSQTTDFSRVAYRPVVRRPGVTWSSRVVIQVPSMNALTTLQAFCSPGQHRALCVSHRTY